MLDAHGKIAWGRADIGGDPIVVVLTRRVADAHLAGLRRGRLLHFAGETELDLGLTLEIVNRELGVNGCCSRAAAAQRRLPRAGLVDEISLAIVPAVDGAKGAPSVFDSSDAETGAAAPVRRMTLRHSQALDGGAVWLRYTLENE